MLTKALLWYTNLDPPKPEGKQLLMTYFFYQSFPDIRTKLKYLEGGPLAPKAEILVQPLKCTNGEMKKSINNNTKC